MRNNVNVSSNETQTVWLYLTLDNRASRHEKLFFPVERILEINKSRLAQATLAKAQLSSKRQRWPRLTYVVFIKRLRAMIHAGKDCPKPTYANTFAGEADEHRVTSLYETATVSSARGLTTLGSLWLLLFVKLTLFVANI